MGADVNHHPPADIADVVLTYEHRHHPNLTDNDVPHTWNVAAEVMDDDGQAVSRVGDLEFVIVDIDETDDPFIVLDGVDVDLGTVAGVIFNLSTGELDAELEKRIMPLGNRILFINRVELEPAWRGFGIGTYLAGLAIKRLSGGCCAAVCYPAPLGQDTPDHDDPAWQAAADRLAELWAQLSFEHFRNGVYVLNLGLTALDNSLERLRTRVLRPSPPNEIMPGSRHGDLVPNPHPPAG